MTSTSLIPADGTIFVWAAVIAIMACAVAMDQRWKWAARINSCTLCILGGLLFANLRVIPMTSPVYDAIGNHVLILAIPLLLFKSDMRKIYRESGRAFLLFHVCGVAAVIAAFLFGFIVSGSEQIEAFVATYCAGAVGGTVNLVAVGDIFSLENNMLSSMLMVANFCAASMLFLFSQMAKSRYMLTHFKHPYVDEYNAMLTSGGYDSSKSQSAQFWKRKDIALIDMTKALATTFVIVAISQLICNGVNATAAPKLVKQLFGSIYLVMTLVTVLGATFLPRYFGGIAGADEMGNIMMLIWFVTIGASCDLGQIIKYGLMVFAIFVVTFLIMCLIVFPVGKYITKCSMEETMACIIASIGGPPTAAALAISNGWNRLVVPGMLVGIYGYVIGNYFGVFVGNILGA